MQVGRTAGAEWTLLSSAKLSFVHDLFSRPVHQAPFLCGPCCSQGVFCCPAQTDICLQAATLLILTTTAALDSALETYQPAAFFPRPTRRWGCDDEYILQFKPGAQVRRCPWMQQPPSICCEMPMICSCLPRAGPAPQKRGELTSQLGHIPEPQHFLAISNLPNGVKNVKLQERLVADLHSCDLTMASCGLRPEHASL